MDVTARLAEHVSETAHDDLPAEAVAAAKRAIRDTLGVALYGSGHRVGERIGAYVASAAPGEAATVLGRGTASAPGAALANGTFAHAVDYDDTFESLVLHPSAPVLPAALAAADATGATGRDLLAGYLVGLDVAFGVGQGVYPAHYERGWHGTGTVGSLGAAAAAASVLGVEPDAVCHAFGIAASGSSSLLRNAGTMTKALHAGHAAQVGVRAALLAREGFTADDAVLDGERGYGDVMTAGGEYDPSAVTAALGERWAVTDVGVKPYPCGRILHAAMDALRRLVEEEGLTPAGVERVTVTLDAAAEAIMTYPVPEDEFQAKASPEFCLAAVLREGDAGVREFTDAYVTDERTREVARTVARRFEENLFDAGYAGYGTRVVVETVDGRRLRAEERHAPGGPDNPLPEERLRAKFNECAGAVCDRETGDELWAAVDALDGDGGLPRLRRALRSVSGTRG